MSLLPSLRPQIIIGPRDAPHTLDLFLDYVCPYSAKVAFKIETILRPLISSGGPYEGKVKLIVRLQVQPWHATSTLVHEAALAALRVSPDNFWAFSLALFKRQVEYFDAPSQDLTIRQIREKLAQLASEVLPADTIEQFKDLLTIRGSANGGTGVTDDLKYNVKFARQNSIHVSPTALWDGLVQPQVESSWLEKEWLEFLAKQVVA